MAYHINTEGNPGLCNAKINCPFGDDKEHYASKNDAMVAFEQKMTNRIATGKRFGANLKKIQENFTQRRGGFYVPRGAVASIKAVEVNRWTASYIQMALKKTENREITDEAIEAAARDAVKDIAHPVNKEAFWSEFYMKVTQEKQNSRKSKLPKSFSIDGGSKPLGTVDRAKKLAKLLESAPSNDLLNSILTSKELQNKLKAQGFSFVGAGEEQVALIHSETNEIWKFEKFHYKSSDPGYVTSHMAGHQSFPETATMRSANTSVYWTGSRGFIVQEKVAGKARPLTEEEWVRLKLSGHDDLFNNYGTDEDGKVVAFDTVGIYWDDCNQYPFTKVKALTDF